MSTTQSNEATDPDHDAGPRADPAGMSAEEALALPVMISLDTANRALGIGRTTGYTLARKDEYPTKVHRLGGQYRVSRADLLHFLGIKSA